MSELPCINCICLAMCKHKCLRGIFSNCKLITTYWRISVNLRPEAVAAVAALSIVQDINRLMNRVLIPTYIDDSKGERFGLVDVEPSRDDHTNTERIIRTCEVYHEMHNINLFELEPMGEYLKVILPPYSVIAIEGLNV